MHHMKSICMNVLALAFGSALAARASAGGATVTCRTEFQPSGEHVFGVPASGARLSWRTEGAVPLRQTQTAYQLEVLAAGTEAPPIWSSGKVEGTAQVVRLPEIVTLGAAAGDAAVLEPDTAYSWRVRVWLSGAPATPISSSAENLFDTAPAAATFPGSAAWIGGGGQLRAAKGLVLPAGEISRARVWVSGMGAFYLFVNGEKPPGACSLLLALI